MIRSLIILIVVALSTCQKPTYNLTIKVNDKGSWKAKLDSNSIYLPGKEFDKGIYLKMLSPVNGDLAPLMEESKGYHFFPYRLLLTDFHYKNPILDNKYLQGTVLINKKSYTVRLEFEYKYLGSVINDDEGNSLKTKINSNIGTKKIQIDAIKKAVLDSASIFNSNKNIFNSIEKSGFNIQDKLNELKTKLNNVHNLKRNNSDSLDVIRQKIDQNQRKYSDHKRLETELKSNIEGHGSFFSQIEEILKELRSQREQSHFDIESFKTSLEVAADQFSFGIERLQSECPSSIIDINNAKEALLSSNNVELSINKIKDVYP